MAKMTLLEIVQNIASAMTSDDVNSISDTVESYQIAQEVRTAYDELVKALNIPSDDGLILLDALNDVSKPNYLAIPETVKQIEWFRYDYQSQNIIGDYNPIQYLLPEEFVFRMIGNQGSSPAIPFTTVTDFSGARLTVLTEANPTYWTTFDNKYIVTDAYNSSVDTTLQQSKSLCWGQYNTQFILQDSFIPKLDENLFPLLLAEAKSTCFANLKQTASPKDEQRAHRQLIRAQNDLWKANQRKPYDRIPNYGRHSPQAWPFNTGTNEAS